MGTFPMRIAKLYLPSLNFTDMACMEQELTKKTVNITVILVWGILVIKYEDDCVGCPPEIGCMGNSCPNRNIPHTYCDRCGDEAKLYQFDDEQICENCLAEEIDNWWDNLSKSEKRGFYCSQYIGEIWEVKI